MAYDTNNIFAKILRGELTAHTVYETEQLIVILDVMPQADGHTLIIPRGAAEDLFDLTPELAAAAMRAAQRVAVAMRTAFKPAGITLMQFNGAEAGQSVFHFHLHVIPRYAGQPLKTHARGMADDTVLREQANRLRRALSSLEPSAG